MNVAKSDRLYKISKQKDIMNNSDNTLKNAELETLKETIWELQEENKNLAIKYNKLEVENDKFQAIIIRLRRDNEKMSQI